VGIPLDEALPIAKQIAEALDAAHEQRIIHGGLVPVNPRFGCGPVTLWSTGDCGAALFSSCRRASCDAGIRHRCLIEPS
jgi:serine/threonine protein kinase